MPSVAFGADIVSSAQVVQLIAGLALVLALIAAAAWFARRMGGWRTQGNRELKIIEGLAVGTREKLLVVEFAGKQILLGVTPGRIAPLAETDQRAAPEFSQELESAARDIAA